MVMKTGAVDAGVGYIIQRLGGREKWLIPILMVLFGLGGTTFGMWEETMAFYPLLLPVFLAAGYELNDTPFLEGRSTTIFSAMFYLFSKHR